MNIWAEQTFRAFLKVKRRDLFHHCSKTLPRDYFRSSQFKIQKFPFPSVVVIWSKNLILMSLFLLPNYMMRNSFHRPRYNLPDCLLEDQCRCNSMLILPQWHLINAKVEPSRCSSHIQVYDASCMQGFKNPFCWVGDSFASSRLANLISLIEITSKNEWMNSVILNIETDLKNYRMHESSNFCSQFG